MSEYSYVATEFGLGWGLYVTTEYYYVATESSRTWGFHVATKGHGVASQQVRACARQRRSVTHNRPWAWAIVWRCVASRQRSSVAHNKAGRARQACARNWDAHTIRDYVHNIGIL